MAQYTLEELRQKFRASDPDYFKDYTNEELIDYIFSEFPSYTRHVIPEELPEQYPTYTMIGAERYDPSISAHAKKTLYNFRAMIGNLENTINTVVETYVQNKIREEDDRAKSMYSGMGALDLYMVANMQGISRENVVLDAQSGTWFNLEDGKAIVGTERPLTDYEVKREIAFTEGSKQLEEERQQHLVNLAEWAGGSELEGYMKWEENVPLDWDNFFMPDMMMRGFSHLAPSVAMSMVGGVIGGPVGAGTVMFAMEGSDEFQSAMAYLVDEQGMDPEEARTIATQAGIAYGAIAAPIEFFALGSALRMMGADKAAKRIVGRTFADRIFKHTAQESLKKNIGLQAARFGIEELKQGAQEAAQNITQLMIEKSYKVYGEGKGLNPKESFKNFVDDFGEALMNPTTKESGLSAIAGMIPGGTIGTIIRTRRQLKRNADGDLVYQGEDLKLDKDGLPTYHPTGEGIDPQQQAQDMYDEVSDEEITDIRQRKELSDAGLILRSYTARTEDYSEKESYRSEAIESDLGEDTSGPKWESAIEGIIEQAPEALEEAGINKEELISQISADFGPEFAQRVEEAFPVEEAPEIVEAPEIDKPPEVVEIVTEGLTSEEDAMIIAARKGDKSAQAQLKKFGVEWGFEPIVRFVGKSEVDALIGGETVKGKFKDGRVDVTKDIEGKDVPAATTEYRVNFKDSFDDKAKDSRIRMKNEQDGWLDGGYDLNDVKTIEQKQEDGSWKVIYDSSKPKDKDRGPEGGVPPTGIEQAPEIVQAPEEGEVEQIDLDLRPPAELTAEKQAAFGDLLTRAMAVHRTHLNRGGETTLELESGVEDGIITFEEIPNILKGIEDLEDKGMLGPVGLEYLFEEAMRRTTKEVEAEVKELTKGLEPEYATKEDIEREAKALAREAGKPTLSKDEAMREVVRKIVQAGATIREATATTAKQVVKDTPKDFKSWIKEFKKVKDLANLQEDLQNDIEFMATVPYEAMEALVEEIALRYRRGSEDIKSEMSIFKRKDGKTEKVIEFRTNKPAILSNARKDLIGNHPADVMINELTQNSFDAKATILKVDILQDEYDEDINLVFEDNGSGMSPDEVETNLFVYGNRAKGEYDAGSYGQAKAAFMLFPKRFMVTTVKDGVETVAEGTSDDLLTGKVKIVSSRTRKSNGTKFEFVLDASENNPQAYRYFDAIEDQMKSIRRPMKAIVRTNKNNKEDIETTELSTTSEAEREVVRPTIKLDYKGNEIEIYFDKVEPYGYKMFGSFKVETRTLNKGLPLPELEGKVKASMAYAQPDFIINVNFIKTPLVDSADYPFIRNRSQYKEDVLKAIQFEINNVLNTENKRQGTMLEGQLLKAIEEAPKFGGVEIILPELTNADDRLKVHSLLARQQAFLSKIGEVFADYNRMLKEAGYKTIDLVITVDPSTHGWRPVVERIGGREVYAINPFAFEQGDIRAIIKASLEPENVEALTKEFQIAEVHWRDILHEKYEHTDVILDKNGNKFTMLNGDMVTIGEARNFWFDEKERLDKEIKALSEDRVEKLVEEKGPRWRSEVFAHALIHEFAHNWGTGHDAEHAGKMLELYMKLGHTDITALKDKLLNIFKTTGANYDNIQQELIRIYDGIDKKSANFREELAVERVPGPPGKNQRPTDYSPLEDETTGVIREVIAHTGKWHELRRQFQDAWNRIQKLNQERNWMPGKVAIDRYIKIMREKLPFWAQNAFNDWYLDAFDIPTERMWSSFDEESRVDSFLDDAETERLVGHLLSEIREGLHEVGEATHDLRYLTRLNAVLDHYLGVVLDLDTRMKWHYETRKYESADQWIDATLEEYTKLSLANLTPRKRDALKLKFHSLKSTIRTNRANPADNDRFNTILIEQDGDFVFESKGPKNVITKRQNPATDRGFITGEDPELSWLRLREVYERRTYKDESGRPRFRMLSRYGVLQPGDLELMDAKLLRENKVMAFIRGETSIALANITMAHKELAMDDAALIRFWEMEGLSKEQIGNMTGIAYGARLVSKDLVLWRAAQVARYSAVKRHFPEFMDYTMGEVFKRLKIPFTPGIRLKGFGDVKVKLVDPEKLSYIMPDGTEVKANQKIKDMGFKNIGDGGTPTSSNWFKRLFGFLGGNKFSKKSKNVIYQVDERGSFMAKHLMYRPMHFTGPMDGSVIKIYHNYEKNGERLIGEIRSDGNIYGSPLPAIWTQKKLDDYIEEHKLTSKNANELIDFFTDDTGQGTTGMTLAAEKILDNIDDMDPGFSLHQKLEFIVSKEQLLRAFVRRVANQAEVTEAEKREMEVFDHLMTPDEAKIYTGVYAEMIKTNQTFTIKGESIGVLTANDKIHNYAAYPDQLMNFVRDPVLQQLFMEEVLPQITEKMKNVFRMSRGKVGEKISSFMDYLRRGPFNAIDNVNADMFELGLGKHPTGLGILETSIQTQGIRPALKLEKMAGMAEDIQADITDTISIDGASVSAKNATIVYSKYAEDPNTDARTNKEARMETLDTINAWLSDNPVWVFGYRVPTTHIHGAGIFRIESLHDNGDVVYLHPETIFRQLEGDGDGDHFYMVHLSDRFTTAYQEYYSRKSVQAKVKGLPLENFVDKDDIREYDFTKIEDVYELMSATMEGKKAIAEIAKTARIYGQFLDRNYQITMADGTKIVMIPPETVMKTDGMKPGSEHTMEEVLRIYSQAATDNAKFLLLRKWGYTREGLRKALFMQEDGQRLEPAQWAAVSPLIELHGRTSEIRRGESADGGVYNFTEQLLHSENYLLFTENRETVYRQLLESEPYLVRDMDGNILYAIQPEVEGITFNEGLSVQEEVIVLPARLYRDYALAGEDGSPFRLMGWNDQTGEDVSIYHMAHDEAVHFIQDDKYDVMEVLSEKGLNAGWAYAENMGNAFYNMWENFRRQELTPGFLGWTTNEDMINFAEKWDKRFRELSLPAQQVATYRFLEGIYRGTGKIRFIKQLPPTSGRATGITLLEPDITKKYLDKYNEVLDDPENRSNPRVRAKTDFVEFEIEAIKKNCK